MPLTLQPNDWELSIVRDQSVSKAAELTGRSRETIRRWRFENLAKPASHPGRPRRKLPDALVAKLGVETDAELSRQFGIPKNSIRNYRLEHGIPALGSDLFNSGQRHLLVTSMLALPEKDRFTLESPARGLGLSIECWSGADESDSEGDDAADPVGMMLLWRHQDGPLLPRAADGRTLLEHLQDHLAPPAAAAVAVVAPGQCLEEASAVLISHAGEVRVGPFGMLVDSRGELSVERAPIKLLRKLAMQ